MQCFKYATSVYLYVRVQESKVNLEGGDGGELPLPLPLPPNNSST
jgi:hypothetical protein